MVTNEGTYNALLKHLRSFEDENDTYKKHLGNLHDKPDSELTLLDVALVFKCLNHSSPAIFSDGYWSVLKRNISWSMIFYATENRMAVGIIERVAGILLFYPEGEE